MTTSATVAMTKTMTMPISNILKVNSVVFVIVSISIVLVVAVAIVVVICRLGVVRVSNVSSRPRKRRPRAWTNAARA